MREESFAACAHNKQDNNYNKFDLWWKRGCTQVYNIMPMGAMAPKKSRVPSYEFWYTCMWQFVSRCITLRNFSTVHSSCKYLSLLLQIGRNYILLELLTIYWKYIESHSYMKENYGTIFKLNKRLLKLSIIKCINEVLNLLSSWHLDLTSSYSFVNFCIYTSLFCGALCPNFYIVQFPLYFLIFPFYIWRSICE